MKTKIALIVTGLALGAAATWYSIRARQATAATTMALTALAQKRATLATYLAQAQERGAATETHRAELQAALNELRDAKPTVPSTTPPAAPKVAAANPRDLLLRDPKLQTLWLNSLHGGIARSYALFFATSGVAPSQVQRLEAAMIRREEQLMDLAGAAQTQGQDARAAITTLRDQARADYEAAIHEVLSDDGVRQLREYEKTASARVLVGSMAGMAALEEAPLTLAQGEQLTKLVDTAIQQEAVARANGNDSFSWEAADRQAREFLTPTQLELFQRSRVDPQLMSAINHALQSEREATSGKASGVGG